MANENFGLGFTVESIALFNDTGPEAGQIGEASTIFASLLTLAQVGESSTVFAELTTLEQVGEASTIFAELTTLEQVGEAGTVDAAGICSAPSILSAPGISVLNTEGGFPPSTLSCP